MLHLISAHAHYCLFPSSFQQEKTCFKIVSIKNILLSFRKIASTSYTATLVGITRSQLLEKFGGRSLRVSTEISDDLQVLIWRMGGGRGLLISQCLECLAGKLGCFYLFHSYTMNGKIFCDIPG